MASSILINENFKMSAKVSRGEAVLNKWANNPKIELSDTGKDWLIAAIDPFHDTQLKNLAGWPDVESNHSVVRCVTQNLNMVKPPALAAGLWDCHCAVFPFQDPIVFSPVVSRANNVGTFDPTGTAPFIGGVTLCAVPGGAAANWLQVPGSATIFNINLPTTYQQGLGRLIGMGYEIHDTTAAIYKQGSMTCYRQNQAPRDPVTWSLWDNSSVATTVRDYTFTGSSYRMPPNTLAQATLMPGNRTWEMKDGLYQPIAFHSNENTPFCADYNQPVLFACGDDDELGNGTINNSIVWVPTPNSSSTMVRGGVTYGKSNAKPMHLHPIHQSGCIMSGLNDLATFTVVVKWYYESFPSIEESAILVLATPSAKYDPMALEIYSRAVQIMPCGVPVCENGFGDWFYDVVDEIGKFINPIVQGAQKAVQVYKNPPVPGGNMASQTLLDKPKKKKKAKKKNTALANGSRGKKGNIAGPLRK